MQIETCLGKCVCVWESFEFQIKTRIFIDAGICFSAETGFQLYYYRWLLES